MLNLIDHYFLQKQEPVKSCMLFLRAHLINYDKNISEHLKYGMPFYYYNNKMFCYLWQSKLHAHPYIGFVNGNKINHPELLQEKRSRMKILLVNPSKDIPVKKINALLKLAVAVQKS